MVVQKIKKGLEINIGVHNHNNQICNANRRQKNAVFMDLLNIVHSICHIVQYLNTRNAKCGASAICVDSHIYRSVSSVSFHSP